MTREAKIPLVLWITAAMVTHLLGGESAVHVAQVAQDRADLRAIARGMREQLHPADTTFEVLTENTEPSPDAKVAAPKKAAEDPSGKADPDQDPEAAADKTKPEPEKIKPPPQKVEPEKIKPPLPPPPPPPPPLLPKIAPPAAAPPPPLPLPPMEADHRIAVRQNVAKDQPDNPTANRIADQANHTDEETVARIRAYDQDDPHATPGGSKSPPSKEVGNDDHTKVADSEEHKGDVKSAPGEAAPASTTAEHNTPPSARPGPQVDKAPPPPSAPGGKGAGSRSAAVAPPAAPPPSPGGAGPASPEVVGSDRGTYTLNPANPGGDGTSHVAGKKKRTAKSYDSPVHVGSIGLGGAGVPGGPNLNLTMAGVEAVVGKEKFKSEREADGAARRSARLGSYEKNKFDRWRAAIENYEPAVKEGNQTSLNAAAAPFATYINTIHNRLHPIFAEEFLASLDSLPKTHALNGDLVTVLEVVLGPADGRIVHLGVVRGSGVTAFDVVSLGSVSRAGPFGKAPDLIVSPDGNVYLHWEFHRDRNDACTTRNAFPYLLKAAPPGPAPLAPRKGLGAPKGDDTPGGAPVPILPLRAH